VTQRKEQKPQGLPAAHTIASPVPYALLLVVFCVALATRAGWGLVQGKRTAEPADLEFPDERQYWDMAVALRAGEGLPDELGFQATRMPLYPSLLAIVTGFDRGVTLARALGWVLGALGAALTAGLAASVFDRRVGLTAGLLVACDPFLIFFSSLLLTEALFLAVLAGLWWSIWRVLASRETARSLGCWFGIGILAALCVYTRESSLGLIVLVLLFVVLCRRFAPRVLLGATCAMLVVIASLVPWAARNQRVIGQWCWLTTRGGISLYDGVGPQATGASDLGDIKAGPEVAGMTEVQWDRYFLDQSLRAVAEEPGRIIRLAWRKLKRMWNPFPNVETYQSSTIRLIAAGWTVPTFAIAVAGVILWVRRNKGEGVRGVLFLLLPALYLSLLHSVFVGSVRYRMGAMPGIEILTAVALATAFVRLNPTRKKG
jgi:4-amino-4-deoxy-L-arabinose transferase-like glycosyltransferase